MITADTGLWRADTGLVTADGSYPHADGLLVEIEWTPGTWTDITSWVNLGAAALQLTVGRQSVWDDAAPGTLALTLDNGDGRFTPDNPLSAYYPHVGADARLQVTFTHGTTSRRRFRGRVDGWKPAFGDEPTVSVTATDRLGQLTRPVPSALQQYLEGRAYKNAPTTTPTWTLLALGEPDSQPRAQRAIPSANPAAAAATLWVDRSQLGRLSSADTAGLGLDPGWTFESADASRRGVALFVPTGAPGLGGLWFCTTQQVTSTEGWDNLIAGITQYGSRTWRVALAYDPAGTQLEIRRPTEVVTATAAGIADGAWHSLIWEDYNAGGFVGPSTRFWLDGQLVGTVPSSSSAYVIVGADALASQPWNVSRQMRGSVAGVWAGDVDPTSPTRVADVATWGSGQYAAAWPTVLADVSYATVGTIGVPTVLGADTRTVQQPNGAGRTILEYLLTLARTVGGTVWHDPVADTITMAGADTARALAASLTVAIGADDAGELAWSRGIDDRPSRATVSAPGVGSVTIADATIEATGVRREVTLDTFAAGTDELTQIASAQLARARRLRATEIPIQLNTAADDLWSALLTIRPGARLTLSSLPSSLFGVTARDLIVAGWTETYSAPGVLDFVLYTDAADDPVEAVWDDAVRGRFSSSGDLVLTAAVTASATTITVTGTSGLYLSTVSGDYPLDLDVGGERVTVTTAPVSAGPTQTLTVTRGVDPSVAAAHAAGTAVEVWAAPTLAL